MDLTKLTHKLIIGANTYVVDEPIGFDGLKTKISRGNYHGMSAEVSVGKIEFYNYAGRNAATLISDAFHSDIDTPIKYEVVDEAGDVLYSGMVDLATYAETTGNCRKVSVNVGEVGIKTTFNNRSEIDIDLNKDTTFSGQALATIPQWHRLNLPTKNIPYVSEIKSTGSVVWNKDTSPTGRFNLGANKSHHWINLSPATTISKNEFGEMTINPDIATDILDQEESMADVQISDYYTPIWEKSANFAEKFGAESTYKIRLHATIKLEALSQLFESDSHYYQCAVAIIKGDTKFAYKRNDTWYFTPVWKSSEFTINNGTRSYTKSVDVTLDRCNYQRLFIGIWIWNSNGGDQNYATQMQATISANSYFQLELTSKADSKSVSVDTLHVGDALNKVIQHISDNGLSLKSDWYRTQADLSYNDTLIDADEEVEFYMGGGALKAITNGYKIRGLYTEGTTERNMPVSFKKMIENLDALDCIGWGILEEDGQLCVRVEPWTWFYKNDVILSIDSPNEKSREINIDRIISSLGIGYKKYADNEDISSIDAFLTERVFTNGIKAVNNELTKTCEWIADTYAIELTRRVAIDASKRDEEFKYDENIFLLETEFGIAYEQAANNKKYVYLGYTLAVGAEHISGISNKTGLYNLRISPRRNAERWKGYIASAVSDSNFKMTSGKVNCKASYETKGSEDYNPEYPGGPESHIRRLVSVEGRTLAENEQISNNTPLLKSEILKIKYPISHTQYKAIMANPYGIIEVDGEKCWIKEMQYELKTGLADLTLIPKY